MVTPWADGDPGVITLPSGGRVRGRALRHHPPAGPDPTLGVYLTARPPADFSWDTRWIKWRDFWLPNDRDAATATLWQAWAAAACGRVEVACHGGIGRTGTALACLCVLDGMSPDDAIDLVRKSYQPRAVETPWQRNFVRTLAAG